jgi:hypothetical protein
MFLWYYIGMLGVGRAASEVLRKKFSAKPPEFTGGEMT